MKKNKIYYQKDTPIDIPKNVLDCAPKNFAKKVFKDGIPTWGCILNNITTNIECMVIALRQFEKDNPKKLLHSIRFEDITIGYVVFELTSYDNVFNKENEYIRVNRKEWER